MFICHIFDHWNSYKWITNGGWLIVKFVKVEFWDVSLLFRVVYQIIDQFLAYLTGTNVLLNYGYVSTSDIQEQMVDNC